MDQKAIAAQEKRKLAFFKELDKLDEISDAEDTGTTYPPKVTREGPTSTPGQNTTGTLVPGSPDCAVVEVRRAVPSPKTGGSRPDTISVVKETPYPPQIRKSTVIKDMKDQMENSPSNRPGARVRGRKKSASSPPKELPESQQIFKGLVFC